ncbi:VOC family protein [Nocardiopsis sp. FIRDI 009]|uniref:VOC family protein n=1 Tax=Nocardiopsis sp. FIRDI 009 TaxID=714197 RepID=UPI000E2790CD|nr:VOC family protein [Nocardiopsis sp. FIRDI 009]
MAVDVQLVVDCAEPLALSRFWAAALEYEVEDNDALIGRLVAAGMVGEDDYTVVDGRRAFVTLAAIRHPDDPVHGDTGIGLGRRLLFQRVPEGKTTKNRLHLDLRVGPERRAETVERLEELGATAVREIEEPGVSLVAMLDPEGNEFDVQ